MKRLTTILFFLPFFAIAQKKITIGAGSAVPQSRTVNGHPLSSDVTVTKSDIGLGNLNNPSNSLTFTTTGTTTLTLPTTGTLVKTDDLLPSNVTSPQQGDVLAYNSGTSQWVNRAKAFSDNLRKLAVALGSTTIAESFPYRQIITNNAMSTGIGYVYPLYLDNDTTIHGVKWKQGTTGSYTANNYNGVILCRISNDSLYVVASSTNDGNIWKGSANTVQSKAFSSSYNAAEGAYFVILVYNSSAQTTAPTIGSGFDWATGADAAGDLANSFKWAGYLSLTAVPTSIKANTITAFDQNFWIAIY